MKKFSGTKIKYYPADSVEGEKIINKNLSKEFGFKIAVDWSKCMKGGHTHNHIRNALERKLNKSKASRKRCHNHLNKGFNYKFIPGRCLRRVK